MNTIQSIKVKLKRRVLLLIHKIGTAFEILKAQLSMIFALPASHLLLFEPQYPCAACETAILEYKAQCYQKVQHIATVAVSQEKETCCEIVAQLKQQLMQEGYLPPSQCASKTQ